MTTAEKRERISREAAKKTFAPLRFFGRVGGICVYLRDLRFLLPVGGRPCIEHR